MAETTWLVLMKLDTEAGSFALPCIDRIPHQVVYSDEDCVIDAAPDGIHYHRRLACTKLLDWSLVAEGDMERGAVAEAVADYEDVCRKLQTFLADGTEATELHRRAERGEILAELNREISLHDGGLALESKHYVAALEAVRRFVRERGERLWVPRPDVEADNDRLRAAMQEVILHNEGGDEGQRFDEMKRILRDALEAPTPLPRLRRTLEPRV